MAIPSAIQHLLHDLIKEFEGPEVSFYTSDNYARLLT